ncbi:DUF599 domain-containing protein [Algicella marina]|uniref:DUF599 family protein n=1 Tax=Algicella marina TaxID=2683284 RepID=A0A6P1SWK7_9RHOB|nr:DUF599 family protein [Algicella marina]QHQ33905.1 DUF599 family protein [Algicella marina]
MITMLPPDFDLLHGLAIAALFAAWFSYSGILKLIARGSLNEQLSMVRTDWLATGHTRNQRPYDAILIGHIVNAIAFFGSATLIVLAGIISLLANVRTLYDTIVDLAIATPPSFELFVVHIAVLGLTLTIAFFSFTYALRKLIYVLALIGAIPEGPLDEAAESQRTLMIANASIVLTEALKTFNFGIRGYYYFVAALGLFISPWLSAGLTLLMTSILIYRQVATRTARAIQAYVTAANACHGRTK